MSCHILETALPEHLHRGRSGSHPSLATCLVRNGITVVRKKCSEASPLEVRVDHCPLSICPIISDQYVKTGENVSHDNQSGAYIRARSQRWYAQWMSEAPPYSCPRFVACHVSWQLPALPLSRDDQSKEIGGRSILQISYYTVSFSFSSWNRSYPVDSSVIM